MTAPKPPTPQGISALLRKAGFAKSERVQSRALGRRGQRFTDGYKVSRDTGQVEVRYWVGHLNRAAEDSIPLMFYAEKIREAGWAAEYGDRCLTFLVVTAPDEPEGS